MIISDDFETLQRMLGVNVVPEEVQRECELWTRFYHAANSGSLGPLALVAILRKLGYQPVSHAEPTANIDWNQYPQDGTLRVEVRVAGSWCPGYFLGFSPLGALVVRVDHDKWVLEVPLDRVRLSAAPPVADELPPVEQPQPVPLPLEEPIEVDLDDEDPPSLIVDIDDEPVWARLVSRNDDGSCVVQLEGDAEPRVLPADKVLSDD
jgi:hypothetical protein